MVGRAQNWGRTQYGRMLAWARRIQDKIGDSSEKWEIRALILFVGGLLIAAAPRFIALLGRLRVARRPRKSPQLAATIWYERMLRQAARRGWNKSPVQTPEEFVSTIGEPQLKGKVLTFTQHYERARFGKSPEEASRLPELYEEIKASGKRD